MNTLTTEHTPDNIIARWLDDHQEELVNTADYIFHHPELAYQETLSSKCLADYLENQGFKITWKTAGIDTAFTAVWGGGKKKNIVLSFAGCAFLYFDLKYSLLYLLIFFI